MFTVTITHDNGRQYVYEDVIGIDFIDKEFCETVAGRKLSEYELNYIENAIDNCETLPDDIDLTQIIAEMEKEEKDA